MEVKTIKEYIDLIKQVELIDIHLLENYNELSNDNKIKLSILSADISNTINDMD